MGDQTDYYAQFMNTDIGDAIFGVDLSLNSESKLASSVAQVAQGVIGQFIADKGGLDRLVEQRVIRHYPKISNDGYAEMKVQLISELETYFTIFLQNQVPRLVREEAERIIKPKGNEDILRDRIAAFSLLETREAGELHQLLEELPKQEQIDLKYRVAMMAQQQRQRRETDSREVGPCE